MRTWRLTAAQRRTLERELARARDADLFRRVLALLEVDAGCPLGEVAQRLRVDRRSVQRWIARYRSQPNIETLRHQPGQGRPRRWDPALEARLELALSSTADRFGLRRHGLDGTVATAMAGQRPTRATVVGGHPPAPTSGARLRVEALPLRAEPGPATREKNAGSAARSGPWPRARCSWPWTKPTCCCCRPCGRVGRAGANRRRYPSAVKTPGAPCSAA
jgi:hypothetical protein